MFSELTKNLCRNPIGIIALFIVLVYSIASLVFGISGSHLDTIQKWPMIGFLVIFPILVLILFGWLVANHHTKLYSPGDYADKEGFFRALTPQEQKVRLDEEALSFSTESISEDISLETDKASKENAEQELATSEESAAEEVRNKILADDRSRYMIAEELAFRELEAEFGQPIHRNVGVGNTNIKLDGIITTNKGQLIAIEIKYIHTPNYLRNVFRHAIQHFENATKLLPSSTQLLLVIVSDSVTDNQFKAQLQANQKFLSNSNIAWQIRFLDFNNLKQKFGLVL